MLEKSPPFPMLECILISFMHKDLHIHQTGTDALGGAQRKAIRTEGFHQLIVTEFGRQTLQRFQHPEVVTHLHRAATSRRKVVESIRLC